MTDSLSSLLPQIMPVEMVGSVVHTDGLATSVAGFPAPVGALVEIERQSGGMLRGEVIGFATTPPLSIRLGPWPACGGEIGCDS